MGRFDRSQSFLNLMGRRGSSANIIGKMTTPSGTFRAMPNQAYRNELRTTEANLDRFRNADVSAIEGQMTGLFGDHENAEQAAVMRLRSLNPELFRSRNDILHEQQRAAADQNLRRGFAASRTSQIVDQQSSIRAARTSEITKQIQMGIEKDLNNLNKQAIAGRKSERAFQIADRDQKAVEGTLGYVPRTVNMNTGLMSESSGNRGIGQEPIAREREMNRVRQQNYRVSNSDSTTPNSYS